MHVYFIKTLQKELEIWLLGHGLKNVVTHIWLSKGDSKTYSFHNYYTSLLLINCAMSESPLDYISDYGS